MARLMPLLIGKAQTGFVRGRSGIANIRKVLTALEYAKQHPREDVIIAYLDAKKAFDNIDWNRLFLTLEKMGFAQQIIDFLRNMYAAPRARVDTGFAYPHRFRSTRRHNKDAPVPLYSLIWR